MKAVRTVRLLVNHGPLIAAQKCVVLGSDDRGLIVQGKAMGGVNAVRDWKQDVTVHGVQENEVVDYVPEPPPLTLKEKIRAIWPP